MQFSSNQLTKMLSIDYPVIGGAMYPCSNPELVAAVSNAGGIGIVQPISLTFVHGYDFRAGLRYIRSLTDKPFGLNLLIESSSKKYREKNKAWLEIALEEGVRFFITALGKPDWVVRRAEQSPGIRVFHDVTHHRWASKAVDAGVHGLICVNNRAGGHAGTCSAKELFDSLSPFGLPLILAGGVGGRCGFQQAMELGYAGVQMGTRLIATHECQAHEDYKKAIVDALEEDIVLTQNLTGVPVSVINTGYVKSKGTETGRLQQWFLNSKQFKHFFRTCYSLRSLWQLRRSLKEGSQYRDYFQAGKSVSEINGVATVQAVFDELIKS